MAETVDIVSVNCRGLGDKLKRRDIFNLLKQKKYSICCLQDTHFNSEMEKYVKAEWGLDILFSSYKSNSRGVAILFQNNFQHSIMKHKSDPNGNFLAVELQVIDFKFTLLNIYGQIRILHNFMKTLLI